jgi:hypothetical protein
MAEQKLNSHIPHQSLIYLGLCLTGVLVFVFMGIIPAYTTLAELDTKAASISQRIEEHNILLPFYRTLLSAGEKKESTVLPLPEKGMLEQTRIGTLPVSLSAAVRMSGMALVSATPNVGALTGDARFISVNLVLRGNFINFRKCLIHLGSIPYVDHIEEIVIQGKADAKEYRLKLWVAIG